MRGGAGRPRRICLVTTGHLSTNPRLVKEADALTEAGYRVRVVACKFLSWADEADDDFAERTWWPGQWTKFGQQANLPRWQWMRIRRQVCSRLAEGIGFRPAIAERAIHYVVPELARAAAAEPADLYIAHNLAALPSAAWAAGHHRAKLGFDAEDFHRGEFRIEGDRSSALTRWVEERFIPRCDCVTAASDGIAEAYAETLQIPRPTTILNVFPLASRGVSLGAAQTAVEKSPGTKTLYWFSQTIGPGRGVESSLDALTLLGESVHLVLRGAWAAGYERFIMSRAEELGVRQRVRALSPVPPGELIARAALHDIGLALELPGERNRDICLSNKIFTYLLAGLPTIVSETTGHLPICKAAPEATRMISHGDPHSIAAAALNLLGNERDHHLARAAATRAAEERWNWEREGPKLLELVEETLALDPAVPT